MARAYVAAVLVFLHLPLVPPVVLFLSGGEGEQGAPSLAAYMRLWENSVLVQAGETSAVLGGLTAVLTPPLALLAAMGVRELGAPRTVLLVLLVPLFVPGVSMGLASVVSFRLLGLSPSLWTMVIAHVVWVLPFAFLILTAMTQVDPVYIEAAHVRGADRLMAFSTSNYPSFAPGSRAQELSRSSSRSMRP